MGFIWPAVRLSLCSTLRNLNLNLYLHVWASMASTDNGDLVQYKSRPVQIQMLVSHYLSFVLCISTQDITAHHKYSSWTPSSEKHIVLYIICHPSMDILDSWGISNGEIGVSGIQWICFHFQKISSIQVVNINTSKSQSQWNKWCRKNPRYYMVILHSRFFSYVIFEDNIIYCCIICKIFGLSKIH